jgi:hypothetical protein
MKRVLILVLALLFIAAGFGFAQKKLTFAYMPDRGPVHAHDREGRQGQAR